MYPKKRGKGDLKNMPYGCKMNMDMDMDLKDSGCSGFFISEDLRPRSRIKKTFETLSSVVTASVQIDSIDGFAEFLPRRY